ncbi:hypothetical protein MKX01_007817 [Papaver californicum]|nr:hypothetical protein MKX01_007817 [Papaver californicum]
MWESGCPGCITAKLLKISDGEVVSWLYNYKALEDLLLWHNVNFCKSGTFTLYSTNATRVYANIDPLYLPFGEMAITINYVYPIWGLTTTGKPVAVGLNFMGWKFTREQWYELCEETVGLSHDVCDEAFGRNLLSE